MFIRTAVASAMCMAATWLLIVPAPADEMARAGRQIAENSSSAVITAQLVLKISDSTEGETSSQELKIEATGTIIDAAGLVVVGLSAAIPTEAMSSGGGNTSTEVNDVRILLADGQELPAKVVLRDRELDLAFIRPIEKPPKPLDALDLTKGTKSEMMDEVVCLYRLGTVASRSLAACCDRVQAIIEKPRKFYAPGLPMMAASLGAPVFTADGNLLGLLLLRTLPGGSDSYGSGLGSNGMLYIILPAADVLEAAKQASEQE